MSEHPRHLELSETFYREFNLVVLEISNAIASDSEAVSSTQPKPGTAPNGQSGNATIQEDSIKKHLTNVAELQRRVQDSTEFSNKHDQRVYAEGIKKLQEQIEGLRSLTKPRGKFSFKSSRKAAGASVSGSATSALSAGATRTAANNNAAVKVEPSATSSVKSENNLIGNGSTSLILRKVQISGEKLGSLRAAALQNLQQSVVYFKEARDSRSSFSGLHVTDVERSLVFCGKTSGGLHISRVRSSVLIATTHQFRMHQCSDVVVYLAAGSMPIIENCESLRFAPLLGEEFSRGVVQVNGNKWDNVLDFQFPGMTGPTQNWTRLDETARGSLDVDEEGVLIVNRTSVATLETAGDLRRTLEKLGLDKTQASEADNVALTTHEVIDP